MLAYKNDKKLKMMLVKEIGIHEKQDQIVKGTYGKGSNGDWKGCAVGCSIHSLNRKLGKSYETSDHSVYEKELGIPEWLAKLEDTIFEGLTEADAKQWPKQFAQAINVGANLEPVKWKFCAFSLKENIEQMLKLDIEDDLKEKVVKAIQGVLNLHEKAIKTGKWNVSAAEAARSAARSAAWSAYKKYAQELLRLLKDTKPY